MCWRFIYRKRLVCPHSTMRINQVEQRDRAAATCSWLTAAKARSLAGVIEERLRGRAGAPWGINTQSHISFCSDRELFSGGRRAQSLVFKLQGIKSGFIFTLTTQPVCSSRGEGIHYCYCSCLWAPGALWYYFKFIPRRTKKRRPEKSKQESWTTW